MNRTNGRRASTGHTASARPRATKPTPTDFPTPYCTWPCGSSRSPRPHTLCSPAAGKEFPPQPKKRIPCTPVHAPLPTHIPEAAPPVIPAPDCKRQKPAPPYQSPENTLPSSGLLVAQGGQPRQLNRSPTVCSIHEPAWHDRSFQKKTKKYSLKTKHISCIQNSFSYLCSIRPGTPGLPDFDRMNSGDRPSAGHRSRQTAKDAQPWKN